MTYPTSKPSSLDLTLMLAPPQNMHSMVSLPNGSTAGLSGIDLWVPAVSKLRIPDRLSHHRGFAGRRAWRGRPEHRLTAQTRTSSWRRPFDARADPAGFPHSCVSRRSIVSGNGGVFYASPGRLVLVGPDSRAVLTEGRFNRET